MSFKYAKSKVSFLCNSVMKPMTLSTQLCSQATRPIRMCVANVWIWKSQLNKVMFIALFHFAACWFQAPLMNCVRGIWQQNARMRNAPLLNLQSESFFNAVLKAQTGRQHKYMLNRSKARHAAFPPNAAKRIELVLITDTRRHRKYDFCASL